MSTTQATLQINAVDQTKRAFESVSKNMKGIEKSTSSLTAKINGLQPAFRKMALAGTVAFGAIAAGVGFAVKEAAKAEGSYAKFNTVFGEGADNMLDFIKDIRKEMPTATHEIVRMSADLQDLLIPMGLARDEAQGLTKGFVTLANKLGAFNDVDPTQVLEAFKSGLSGSSEPLRRFGINALETSLEMKAMELGLIEAKVVTGDNSKEQAKYAQKLAKTSNQLAVAKLKLGEANKAGTAKASTMLSLKNRVADLSAKENELAGSLGGVEAFTRNVEQSFKDLDPVTRSQVKAHALLALATDQSADAINGFAANNDSFIRRSQALQATIKELQVAIGNIFLPIMDDLLKKFGPVIDKIQKWVEENPKLTKNIIIISAAIAGLIAIIGFLGIALGSIIALGSVLTVAFGAVLVPLLVIVGTIAALIAVGWLLLNHWDVLKEGAIQAFTNIGETILAWWSVIKAVFLGWSLQLKLLWKDISNFWELVKGAGKSAGNFLVAVAEGYANAWVMAVNTIVKALNTIQISIPDWVPKIGGKSFGINLPLIPEISIPRLADGGIATQSVLANIGEAGPEAIIPLDRLNDFGVGGGRQIVVNITGNQFLGEDDFAETVGDRIIDIVKSTQRI